MAACMKWLDVQGGGAWQAARDDGRAAVLRLPYPPSANNLFAPVRKRSRRTGLPVLAKRKTAEATAYAEEVWYHVRSQRGHRQFAGPLALLVCATPPRTGGRRDVANIEKAVTDSMVAAGVMLDDSQVKDLRLVWAPSAYGQEAAGPGVEVSVRELSPDELALLPARRTARQAAGRL